MAAQVGGAADPRRAPAADGTRTVVLLAGASGSGKSRLATSAGCPRLNLDDFYHDGDAPGLPRTLGIVDWDHPASWDQASAVAAVVRLCREGSALVPVYDIARSARAGEHRVDVSGAPLFVAEGVFAPEVVRPLQEAGVAVEPLYLDRSRTANLLRRFLRDVAEHRKPLPVLVRRGWALWRREPADRAHALAAGCRPVPVGAALSRLRAPTTTPATTTTGTPAG